METQGEIWQTFMLFLKEPSDKRDSLGGEYFDNKERVLLAVSTDAIQNFDSRKSCSVIVRPYNNPLTPVFKSALATLLCFSEFKFP